MVKAYTSAGDESRLLEAMYGAALGENDWTEVLTFLRQATGVALVALLSQDPRTDLPLLNAVATHDDAWAEQAMGSYQREFFLHDPTPAAVQGWQAGRWFNDRRAFSEHERAHSLYYQEFLRPQGLGSWSGTYLFNEPHSQAFISLQCLADDKRSEDPDLRLSDGLTAHLARALRVASRLGDVQRRAVVAESTLDQLETPVLLLEEETGRLLLANAAARRLMQAEPVLAFRGDRVAPGVLSDSATWRAACRAGGCVLRAASGAPMALSLIPVPPGSTLARSWPRPLVLMSLPSNKSAAARAPPAAAVWPDAGRGGSGGDAGLRRAHARRMRGQARRVGGHDTGPDQDATDENGRLAAGADRQPGLDGLGRLVVGLRKGPHQSRDLFEFILCASHPHGRIERRAGRRAVGVVAQIVEQLQGHAGCLGVPARGQGDRNGQGLAQGQQAAVEFGFHGISGVGDPAILRGRLAPDQRRAGRWPA